MISSNIMSSRLHLSIHSRRPDWHCPSQLLTRHCTSRHILCRSTFPLRLIHRGCIRYHGRICPLIPIIFRIHSKRDLSKNSLPDYICRCKYNLLPPALPRSIRHATTLLRLPRRVYHLKHSIFHRLIYFTNCSDPHGIHDLRSLCLKTRGINRRINYHKPRMTTRVSPTISHV